MLVNNKGRHAEVEGIKVKKSDETRNVCIVTDLL
jgi:hypothetical protein